MSALDKLGIFSIGLEQKDMVKIDLNFEESQVLATGEINEGGSQIKILDVAFYFKTMSDVIV